VSGLKSKLTNEPNEMRFHAPDRDPRASGAATQLPRAGPAS
jgi:hypothetical protein